MRRRNVHMLFGIVVLVSGLATTYHGLRLLEAQRINAAIAQTDVHNAGLKAPEIIFARALALSKEGDFDGALEAYKSVSMSDRPDLRQAALYNLGNLQLRESLKTTAEGEVRELALIELAKQSYRDLLRENPEDWDARYNLERALWLAPEFEEPIIDAEPPRDAEERVMSTISDAKRDLP